MSAKAIEASEAISAMAGHICDSLYKLARNGEKIVNSYITNIVAECNLFLGLIVPADITY
jgi:hypothetical protein